MSTPYPQQPAGQPAQPVKRRVSYKLAGILSGIGALLAVSPFLAWFVIELIPGDHGDGGDGLYWLAVGMIFYVLPFGLILIVAGIVSAVMNSSSRSRSRQTTGPAQPPN